jgi:hypothetical protein
MKIKGNSALAVVDKLLRKKNLLPVYKKDAIGVLLDSIQNQNNYSGILCFVNGEEPGNATLPLDKVTIKVGDKISLCFVEQGVYKGDFKEKKGEAVGLHPIFIDEEVREVDLKEYVIPLV